MSSKSNRSQRFRKHAESLLPRMGVRILEDKFFNAIYTRNVPQIKGFLKKGVNPNKRYSNYGVCVLHLLAERDDSVLGFCLIQNTDVNLNSKTLQGYTALHFCAIFNCKKFLTMLLSCGADSEVPDRMGKTALHHAVVNDHYGIALKLLKFGAQANVLDCFEETPLSISILQTRNMLIAKTLLSYGADMSLESQRNLHIFFEAILSCNTEKDIDFVVLLLDNGVDIGETDPRSGRSCLHFVAINGCIELAIVLIERGAEIKVFDFQKRSPAKTALEHGNAIMADYLRKGYRPPRLLRTLPLVFMWRNKLKERVSQRNLLQPE